MVNFYFSLFINFYEEYMQKILAVESHKSDSHIRCRLVQSLHKLQTDGKKNLKIFEDSRIILFISLSTPVYSEVQNSQVLG